MTSALEMPCIRYVDFTYLPLLSVPYVYKFTGKPLLTCNMRKQVESKLLGHMIILLQFILNDVISLRRKVVIIGVNIHVTFTHKMHVTFTNKVFEAVTAVQPMGKHLKFRFMQPFTRNVVYILWWMK